MSVQDYKSLIVWQKALKLVICTYELTEHFPKSEMYGLVSQMRRASVSIPSNIAEGSRRSSRKDFRQFILNAYGSGAELETQIEIAKLLPFGKNLQYIEIDGLLNEVMRMLNGLQDSLSS